MSINPAGLQTWAAANALKLILLAILAIAAGWWFLDWLHDRDDAKALTATVEAQDAKAEATQGIAEDLGTAAAETQRVEVVVHADTQAYNRQLEQARREKPDLDRFLSQPWPSELRDLARARRIARDRPGAAAPGSRAADPGAPAPRGSDAR